MFLFFIAFHCYLDVFSSGDWATLSVLRDPSLKHLASRLESTLLSPKAPGTINAYRRAFRKVEEFCLLQG